MFYISYTGPKRVDLDVIGASANVDSKHQIQFIGQLLGPIDASQTAEYSFLVNRGGARPPGPIKGQPNIFIDAIVQATTGVRGTTTTVSLLNSQNQLVSTTSLPAKSTHITGSDIRITIPLSLLPPSNPHFGNYSYTFSTSVPGNSESDIAGFAPQDGMAVVNTLGSRHT
jgi:hypothetical protein